MPEATWAAALAALLGFAVLALGQERHWSRVSQANRPVARAIRAQRAIASIAIASALPACIAAEGPAFGCLLWALLLMATALVVSLTLTWRPHWLLPLARLLAAFPATRRPSCSKPC